MKIDPPIRVNLPQGCGDIIEMSADERVVTVRLDDGKIITLDGSVSAEVHRVN